MRTISRVFWTFLAVLFLIEAWLWEKLEPVVAAVVRAIPLARVKAAIAAGVNKLPPFAVLFVFLIPVVVLFPFKLAAIWLLANGQIILAVGVYVLAKLVGVGVAAFLFETCKPKLIQMRWFAALYEWVRGVLAWAHRLVDPIKERIRGWMARLRGKARNTFARRFGRVRGLIKRRRDDPAPAERAP
jgi:hypothetical protein